MRRFRVYLSVSVVALSSLVLIGSSSATANEDQPLHSYHVCNSAGVACVTVQ